MTWLAWRQLRTPAFVAALGVVALLVALAITGPSVLHIYDAVVAPCSAHADCQLVTAHFFMLDDLLRHLSSTMMLLAPVLFGLFFGAPLIARELETGTYRLAWTQSVTRTRWIATRLVMVAVVTAVLTGLLAIAVTWWQRPFDTASVSQWYNFEARDVVVVAYAVFAVALGALLGAIVRRTLVAMACSIVAYAGVRYLVEQYVRPSLFAPMRSSSPFHLQVTATGAGASIGPPGPTDWVVAQQIVTGTGKAVYGGWMNLGGFNVTSGGTTVLTGVGPCPNRIPPHALTTSTPDGIAALQRCIDSFHLRDVVTYQPISRYWPLQWSETAIFVVLALAAGAACVWVVRRRLP